MTGPSNPYAAALDGLVLEDPVTAFFDFCRERERIRVLRESGAPAPWSADPVFRRGRFLNVFREDDRGSKAIVRFVGTLVGAGAGAGLEEDLGRPRLQDLVHALFFARWCNKQSTLDRLSVDMLSDPAGLRRELEAAPPAQQPWCNVTAYPVEPVRWEGEIHSRLDTATRLLKSLTPVLTDAICSAGGDVVGATHAANRLLGMKNDFPIFMAVMDLAWFRPDVIDPASPVPTGIGAVAFLDRLQQHLGLEDHEQTCRRMIELQPDRWPEARRGFHPIDVEYLSCECRKYFSYLNGTKRYEGKNVFRPGESARLTFDIPEDRASGAEAHRRSETRIHVIAGGPCSGKTTVLNALARAGHRIEVETAERVLREGIAAGSTADELRADPIRWQQDILRQDHALFDRLATDELIFTDTSFLETLVFASRAGIVVGPNIRAWLERKRYARVYFLEPLASYEQSAVRRESQDAAVEISGQVRACYRDYGYEPVVVPDMPVAERVAFIRSFTRRG